MIGADVQTEKQMHSAPNDMYLFSWVYNIGSQFMLQWQVAEEKQTSGPWSLKSMHLQLLFPLLFFRRSVQMIHFIIFLKVKWLN